MLAVEAGATVAALQQVNTAGLAMSVRTTLRFVVHTNP